MLGWLFAQIATIAHACPLLTPDTLSPAASAVAVAAEMPADCAEMAKQAESTANVCQSHCVVGDQVDAQPPASTLAIAPQPALIVQASDACVTALAARASPSLHPAAPPGALRFSRLLI